MVRRMYCVLALALLICTGCGDGGAEVSKKQFDLLGKLRDTMAKVKDAATLKSELPNLEKISQDLAAAQAELNKLQITTEQQRDLRAKYGKDLETLQKELVEQSKRLDALPEVDEKDRDQLVAALTAAKTGTTP